jgi:hypothetical protein
MTVYEDDDPPIQGPRELTQEEKYEAEINRLNKQIKSLNMLLNPPTYHASYRMCYISPTALNPSTEHLQLRLSTLIDQRSAYTQAYYRTKALERYAKGQI